jgi:hypothetical protein
MTVRKEPGEDWAPDHMARWLEAVSKRLYADLGAQGGFAFPELRGSHRRLLQMIPPEGIRITDLARRADMTKQALMTRTEQGDAAAIEAQRAIDAVERGWRREIGAARYDAMKQVLRQLGRDQTG